MAVPIQIKKKIRKFHLTIDSWIGRLFWNYPCLIELSEFPHDVLTPEKFYHFLYSRLSHFTEFHVLPGYHCQSPATCDLKVYQDALVFTYILDNLPKGARLLEVGGGESRVIEALKNQYEFWNLDKLEGEGFGPKVLYSDKSFTLVSDYIGSFSPKLPNEYFDLVFSISTLEHIPQDRLTISAVIEDIQRVLKPGGYSLHCIDALISKDHFIFPDIISVLHQKGLMELPIPSKDTLLADSDLWLLPKYSFYTRWYHLVRKSMSSFGHPFSINVLWKK